MMKMKDMPPRPGVPALPEADKNKVMHVALPILGGTQIMATDMVESMGHQSITLFLAMRKIKGWKD